MSSEEYKKPKRSLIDYLGEDEKERTDRYRRTGHGVFTAIKKCSRCKGKLILTRKVSCYEFLRCKKCGRLFRRNVLVNSDILEDVESETCY